MPAVRLPTLISEHNLDIFGFLIVDAEGSDLVILKDLLGTQVRPGMILYENLMMTPSEHDALNDEFHSEGYRSLALSQDTFLYRS